MREERNKAETFKQFILRDPILVSFIEKTINPGIDKITFNRKVILAYENLKTETQATINPWTGEITFTTTDNSLPPLTFHYTETIKLLTKAFGRPEIIHIYEEQANIPGLQEFLNKIAKEKPL